MFGLSDKAATRSASRGRTKGVTLVRAPRRTSWLAGWTPPAVAPAGPADSAKPAAASMPPANRRHRT